MCTLSWRLGKNGYDVFFNRDEQRSRLRADVPQIYSLPYLPLVDQRQLHGSDNIHSIMPIDPQGGGTWLGVNEFGWTFALLNYYQGRLPKGALRSRGQIVKELVRIKCRDEINAYFDALPLNKFAPFSLIVFYPPNKIQEKSQETPEYLNADNEKINMIRWTGKELQFLQQESPLFSSAIKFDEVSSARHSFVKSELNKKTVRTSKSAGSDQIKASPSSYIDIHKSHEPSKSAFSICMHRDDAKTVSFSHVQVGSSDIIFTYTDGAPCETEANQPVSLALKNCNIS